MRVPDWVNSCNNFSRSFPAVARNAGTDTPLEKKEAPGRLDSSSVCTGREKGVFQELFDTAGNESANSSSPSLQENGHASDRLEALKAFSQTWDINLLKVQNKRESKSGSPAVNTSPTSKSPDESRENRSGNISPEVSAAQDSPAGDNAGEPMMTRFKDSSSFSYEHSVRVGDLAAKLAGRVGSGVKKIASLGSELSRYYNELGKYHDIGKFAIPFEILEKPGSLTPDEQQVVRAHPIVGESMLKDKREFKNILPAVRHHHERWDGKGYPDGLKGNDIPLEARIISVVDSFDAIVSDRPYRKGVAPDKALDELKRCAGTQFDPQIVHAFTQLLSDEFSAATA